MGRKATASADGEIPLNDTHRKLLKSLREWRGPGLARPSVLAEMHGFAGEATVRHSLKQLEERGLVQRTSLGRGLPNALSLTEAGHDAAILGHAKVSLPYYHAGVHAGECAGMYDDPEQFVHSLGDLFSLRGYALGEGAFLIRVVGDCMDGGERPIREGDVVLCRPADRLARPRNGEAAYVCVTNLETGEVDPLLRNYWFDEIKGEVTLVPRNSEYEQTYHDDLTVEPRGVVVCRFEDFSRK